MVHGDLEKDRGGGPGPRGLAGPREGQRDLVDCGSGRDWYNADFFDVIRNCEVPAS